MIFCYINYFQKTSSLALTLKLEREMFPNSKTKKTQSRNRVNRKIK